MVRSPQIEGLYPTPSSHLVVQKPYIAHTWYFGTLGSEAAGRLRERQQHEVPANISLDRGSYTEHLKILALMTMPLVRLTTITAWSRQAKRPQHESQDKVREKGPPLLLQSSVAH